EKFMEYVHQDDRDYIRYAVKEAFKMREIKISRFHIISKNQKLKYVKASGKIINWENTHMIVGTIQDITNDTLLTEHLKLREKQIKKEYRIKDKRGNYKYIYSKREIKRDVEGNIRGLFGVHMDITQLREHERKLHESELFSNKVIDLLPNIVYIFDLDERKDI